MTPAPRRVSDEEVFAAAYRAMSRLAPHELSLAAIAEEAGVTPSALVQRFGSKRELQLRLATHAAASTPDLMKQLRETHKSPLSVVRAYAGCIGDLATTPAALARNLAYLQTDITDPELRASLRKQATATARILEHLLAEAADCGELKADTPIDDLVRTLEHVLSGALLTWAIYQRGRARPWVLSAVDAALRPFIPTH
jgi:AcrR family transcriptional regulator